LNQLPHPVLLTGVTATPGDVNIITIEKVIPEKIGIAIGIVFLCAVEINNPLT